MASHSELRPDDAALPLLIASAALSKAESRLTVATGTVVADNADGTQTWIGSNGSDDTNGVIKWVGDLSAPGRPSGLSAACSMQCVVVSWDGTLENGVPSDFAYIEVFARREGSVDDVVSWGRLSSAGMLMSPRYEIGTVFDVYAIAYDDAHDSTGALARNQSEQSDLITVAVEQDADMEQIDAAVEEMSKKADEAGAKADKAYEEAKKTGQLAVTASRTEYATSTDATATPSDGWSETPPTYMDGQYTWLRVTVTYGDGHTELSNPVLMTGPKGGKGETGETGTAGVSVTSLTTFWRLAADTPDTPSGADDPSGWSRTEPSIPDGYEGKLYRTIRTIMSDGMATWTSPDVDSMFEYMARTYRTASGAVTVSSEAKRTAEGNAETIKQVGATANDALSKATTVETNFAGFKTEVSETYQAKADMSTYSTKSYVDETSKSVALGVVQGYKGADGSGLATKSDISVSRTEITSEVSNTYATKDGVSEEISSKITQNNGSWELKFATKTEAKSAQDAANTANAAAADAQSRVGNLEPCIRMTSDGVRVGKQANGTYQGTSALVGTDGTFDVLDTSGKRLLEVSATGVKFPHSKDGTRLALGYVAGSGSASDTLYIGDIITGQQEGGPKNRLGFTGDEVSLEGGDISINANDNQLSLYGRKGANLLVPDGGNVQVGGQSGTSNTTLTLRGSTVNLSGGLVNVNGRTLNAPVDAKQSQRWDNIQLDVKCVNRVVTVNILHPLGSNAIIGDQNDQCEIGYIKEGYRPSRMIGCHLAAYNTTNLFLEINPATGKVACFRLWGNQNTWAYFSASLSYVI